MPKLTVGSENNELVELHYEDRGAGKPVVLIHGWPLSNRAWEAQVPALVEAGHRVITYDRRGFGASTQTWTGYDYDTFAADLHALIMHLDLREATLVGFSMGGGEVARYIGRYGTERIARAALVSAVPPFLYKAPDNPDGGLDDATIGQFEDGVRSDRAAFLDGFTTQFFSAKKSLKVSEPQRQYALAIASFASPKGTLDCIGAFSRTDFRGDLAKFDVPTLVLHGDSDGIVPFEVSGKRSAAAIPGSRVILIEGGPHGITSSHAAEVNRALIGFLGGLATMPLGQGIPPRGARAGRACGARGTGSPARGARSPFPVPRSPFPRPGPRTLAQHEHAVPAPRDALSERHWG